MAGGTRTDLGGMTHIVGRQFVNIVGRPLVNIAGIAIPVHQAPSMGGASTPAHEKLYRTGLFSAAHVTNMPAAGAQVALSLLKKGATADDALAASGAHQVAAANTRRGNQYVGGSAMNGPMEVPMNGNGPREFPMGFGITPIANGATQIINAQPQVNFRPSRLVIPDSIAPSFMINDFKIGMRSQLVAPGSIPAQSFTQTAVGTAMALDTVNVGQFVTLDVTNVAAQPVNFAASLFGTTLNS